MATQATQADIMRARLRKLEKSPFKETISTALRTAAKTIGTAELILDIAQNELISAFEEEPEEAQPQQSDEV